MKSCLVPQEPWARLERYARELVLVAMHGAEQRAGFLRRHDPYLGGVAAWLAALPASEIASAFEDALRMRDRSWPRTVLGLRLASPPWFQQRLSDPTAVWLDLAYYQPESAAVDPVCQMVLDPRTTEYLSRIGDQTVYFCCPHCQAIFAGSPSSALASLA